MIDCDLIATTEIPFRFYRGPTLKTFLQIELSVIGSEQIGLKLDGWHEYRRRMETRIDRSRGGLRMFRGFHGRPGREGGVVGNSIL